MHPGGYIIREILADRLPILLKKIARVNEKLKAGALPLIEVTHEFNHITNVKVVGAGTVKLPMARVLIAREAPSAATGYVQLLAKTTIEASLGSAAMQHRTYGEITPEQRERIQNPKEAGACDHCTSNRQRSYIFTLNTPGGTMRVGGGCLKDFMGFDMSRWTNSLNEVIDEAERLSHITFKEINEHEVIPVRMFLGEAIKHVATHGYRNRDSGYPTGGLTFEICQALIDERESEMEEPEMEDQVSAVIGYIKNSVNRPEDINKDYFVNLRTMLDVGYLTQNQANLIASSVASFHRFEADLAKKAANSTVGVNFIGTQKERLVLKDLRIEGVYPDHGQYGTTSKFTFIDADNNVYQWKASGFFEPEIGRVVTVQGTVKEHSTFFTKMYGKEVNCTVLTHCKFLTPEDVLALESKKPRKKSAAPVSEVSPLL
jgi:hypothetical protein